MGQYKTAQFFMIRTPLLSQQLYNQHNSSENILDNIIGLEEYSKIEEAILIGSKSLYDNMKKNSSAREAVMKYFIRMTTRPTPYGLFSGVGVGNFADTNSIELSDIEGYRKRARVDMEWLLGLALQLEDEYYNNGYLRVKINPIIYKKGKRVINPYVTIRGKMHDETNEVQASIRNTRLFEIVQENAKDFIECKNLYDIILKEYSGSDLKKVKNYIYSLIEHEYLLSELRPILTGEDPFHDFIEKIKNGNIDTQICQKLIEISKKIDYYNTLPIGMGKQQYFIILNDMKELYRKVKNYLEVDLLLNFNKNMLNDNLQMQIGEFCDFLSYLGTWNRNSLEQYKNDFIAKYGLQTEVNILQLLDEDLGIGAPISYSKPVAHFRQERYIKNEREVAVKTFLYNEILNSVRNDNEEVILDRAKIEQVIGSNHEYNNLAPSLEINFMLCKNSTNNPVLVLGPNAGSDMSGRTFGRFMDMFENEKISQFFVDCYQDDLCVAELIELTQNSRLNNLTIGKTLPDYQICVGTSADKNKFNVKLNDLYIGIEKNKFYIRSNELKKKICVISTNMLNYQFYSNIGRLLLEISRDYYGNPMYCTHVFQFNDLEYVPRIKYKDIVIALRQWHLNINCFNAKESIQFLKEFKSWCEERKVPQFVYLVESDNRLLLNTKVDHHINIVYKALVKHGKKVTLSETETNCNTSKLFVKDSENNHFNCEIVVPVFNSSVKEISDDKKNVINTKSDYYNNRAAFDIQHINRNLFPGDQNWFYFNIYMEDMHMDEVIGDDLNEFMLEMINKKIIKSCFFLRYADPETHIRFRLCSNVKKQCEALQNMFIFLNILRNKGYVFRYNISNYEREIERYGGMEVIENAENYFCADSILVSKILSMKRERFTDYDDVKICMLIIAYIMKNFGLSKSAQRDLLSSVIAHDQMREKYKKRRKEYISYLDINSLSQEEQNYLSVILDMHQNALKDYKKVLMKFDGQNMLTNDLDNILLSLIHMFLNRVKGNRDWELEIMALLRHSLYDSVQRENKLTLGER